MVKSDDDCPDTEYCILLHLKDEVLICWAFPSLSPSLEVNQSDFTILNAD